MQINKKVLPQFVSLLLVATLTACFERPARPINPCTRSNNRQDIQIATVDKVDLLFMVDNSGSMATEQERVGSQVPRIVNILSTGDLSGGGVMDRDFPHVQSLHVGIVVSDMGIGGAQIGSTAGCVTATGASASVNRFGQLVQRVFSFPGDTAAVFASAVTSVGTGGCGIERQIDALTRAISPAAATAWTRPGWTAPTFALANGATEPGLAGPGGLNDGFVRADSAIAVIVLSDEDDSSVDPATNATNYYSYATGSTGLHPSVKASIEWYNATTTGQGSAVRDIRSTASSLVGLRSVPGLFIYAAIVGVPDGLSGAAPTAILQDGRMRPRVYTNGGACPVDGSNCGACDPAFAAACANRTINTELIPVCIMPEVTANSNALAAPGYREVQLGQELANLGARVTIQSICQRDYGGAIDGILRAIADALRGACLPRPLNRDSEGKVACDVLETLPPGMTCAAAGLMPLDSISQGGVTQERCTVSQLLASQAMGSARGWFYQTLSGTEAVTECRVTAGQDAQRIAFWPPSNMANSPLINGSRVSLQCLQTVTAGTETTVDVGDFCDPTSANPCAGGLAPDRSTALTCDSTSRTCLVPCTEASQCTRAGLLGYTCDTRGARNFCVNPSCS